MIKHTTMFKFILVNKLGVVENTTMRNCLLDNLYKKCGFKNNTDFEKRTEWRLRHNNEKISICVYAKTIGRAQNENKYELPPPIDKHLYFGNIAIVSFDKDNNLIELDKEMWETFYNQLMGGFEDIENTDEEEEEYEEDNYSPSQITKDGYLKDGFIVSDPELSHESYDSESDIESE